MIDDSGTQSSGDTRAHRTSIITGAVFGLAGVLLRFSSNSLAWPSSYTYTGERANQPSAIREAAYNDLSVALLVLGVGLVLLGVHHALARRVVN